MRVRVHRTLAHTLPLSLISCLRVRRGACLIFFVSPSGLTQITVFVENTPTSCGARGTEGQRRRDLALDRQGCAVFRQGKTRVICLPTAVAPGLWDGPSGGTLAFDIFTRFQHVRRLEEESVAQQEARQTAVVKSIEAMVKTHSKGLRGSSGGSAAGQADADGSGGVLDGDRVQADGASCHAHDDGYDQPESAGRVSSLVVM